MSSINFFKRLTKVMLCFGVFFAAQSALASSSFAQGANPETAYTLDNLFIFFAAVLVLMMQAGFAMLEVGLNARKNTINILFKNILDMSIGILIFFLFGYGIMYPGEAGAGGYFAFGGMFAGTEAPEAVGGNLHPQIDWFFQAAFAAAAATIVSGAVAGRLKFASYVLYSAALTGLIYPISGMWKWGGGWLDAMGFYDFAGSIVVHAVGGFGGLAGAIALGPRIGRFTEDGKSNPLPGHSLSLATLGVFLLWIGWYGFNCGSQLAVHGADNISAVALVAVNTTLAAASGCVVALLLTWTLQKKPEISMVLNGALAGLVGITANCDSVENGEAVMIGMVAGAIVYAATRLLEKLKIDDPVGAWPVHGACGIWGGIATGIFGDYDLGVQILGSVVVSLWAFFSLGALFYALKMTNLLRVSAEEEQQGLDIAEHGGSAYQPV